MAVFYLGVDDAHWLGDIGVPLFVSRRRLHKRRTLPRAAERWALDSGGFTEMHKYGEWRLSSSDYASQVKRYADEIGRLDWAAPQDWMCEQSALGMSGRTVAEHQDLTVQNFLDLRQRLGELVIPVLQGWEFDDYQRCVELYDKAGVDLTKESTVGLGSVCRREADREITRIIDSLQPLRLHAFGVKGESYVRCEHLLASADSMAWSYTARYDMPLPGHTHRRCHHCQVYALRWRSRLLARTRQLRLFQPHQQQ
jgi:hypothetical protein